MASAHTLPAVQSAAAAFGHGARLDQPWNHPRHVCPGLHGQDRCCLPADMDYCKYAQCINVLRWLTPADAGLPAAPRTLLNTLLANASLLHDVQRCLQRACSSWYDLPCTLAACLPPSHLHDLQCAAILSWPGWPATVQAWRLP